jgi:hypothetical protein
MLILGPSDREVRDVPHGADIYCRARWLSYSYSASPLTAKTLLRAVGQLPFALSWILPGTLDGYV